MNAICTQTRGGWVFGNTLLRGTGVAVGTIISLFSHPVEAHTGTAGLRPVECRECYDALSPRLKIASQDSPEFYRTVAEDLGKVRSVFKPAVSDLAGVFGVSRQAIYNWLAGEEPISTHEAKIRDLASAADLVYAEGVVITGQIMKRKIANGKSFLELVQDGGSAKGYASLLLELLRTETEQKTRMEQRLGHRKNPEKNPLDIGSVVFNEIG